MNENDEKKVLNDRKIDQCTSYSARNQIMVIQKIYFTIIIMLVFEIVLTI